jgi:hypothetical protein
MYEKMKKSSSSKDSKIYLYKDGIGGKITYDFTEKLPKLNFTLKEFAFETDP